MTPKQRRFIEHYTGNATKAAIAAGYSEKTAYRIGAELLQKTSVKEAIQQREEQRLSEAIANREERQIFWSAIMRNAEEKTADRLKASELLAKSNGDFLERVQAMVTSMEVPKIEVHFTRRNPETGEWERDYLDEEE